MAIGDDATGAGYPLVPNTGEDGRVRYGAREINRTRDLVAGVKNSMPVGKAGYRTAAGITSGTTDPLNTFGSDGDIYIKTLA